MPNQSILDALRTPLPSDPFYDALTRLSEEKDLAIPTVNLTDRETCELRALVKSWSDSEPVAGIIE